MDSDEIRYRDCVLRRLMKADGPLAWEWCHIEFTGSDDFRCGYGSSLAACKTWIDEMVYGDDLDEDP
jgi:hypothetical protein